MKKLLLVVQREDILVAVVHLGESRVLPVVVPGAGQPGQGEPDASLRAGLVAPAFDALRQDWRESAALLGAGTWDFWRHIGLPVLTPALLGTFVILLANALGAYATVYYLTTGNFNVLPIRIAAMVSGDISLNPNLASALSMILVGLMVLITIVHQLLLKRSNHVTR